jgi:hypothetical protein
VVKAVQARRAVATLAFKEYCSPSIVDVGHAGEQGWKSGGGEVTLGMTTCRRILYFEKSLHALLNALEGVRFFAKVKPCSGDHHSN